MQELRRSLDLEEGSLRRSSRKRRIPGEWWREFRTETRALSRRYPSGQNPEARKSSPPNENCTVNIQGNKTSKSGENQLHDIGDEEREAEDGLFDLEDRSCRDISMHEVANKNVDLGPADCAFAAEDNTMKSVPTKGKPCHLNPAIDATPPSIDFESNVRDATDPDPNSATAANLTSTESRQQDRSSLISAVTPRRGGDVGEVRVSCSVDGSADPTPRNLRGNSSSLSGKEKNKNIQSHRHLTIHKDAGKVTSAHDDDNQENCDDKENSVEGKRQRMSSASVANKHLQTSPTLRETDGILEACRSTWDGKTCNRRDAAISKNLYSHLNRFSRLQHHHSLAGSNLRTPGETPRASRRLCATGFVDGLRLRNGGPSTVHAPRKSRLKPASPSYSFSLRSCLGDQSSPMSMLKASGNRNASMSEHLRGFSSVETALEDSNCARQDVLVAKKTALRYNLVTGPAGIVKVAISISLNLSTIGEIVIPPRSATGPRRAVTGDEFYIVKHGYVECDIGFTNIRLSPGDHLGIPEGQCFEIRNPSPSRCELFFFSPRN